MFKAPTGKHHSSLVDHDRCVFIRNNAKTDFAALTELPVEEYEKGDDCVNCEAAIADEVASAGVIGPKERTTPADTLPVSDGSDEDDDWEDEDEYVVDPDKKAVVEAELGIQDAEKAIENWEYIAERAKSVQGREFWSNKALSLRSAIEFIPESSKPEAETSEEPAAETLPETEEGKADEQETGQEKRGTSRRKATKKAAASAAAAT